jgi:ribonuclease HII
MLDYHPSPLGVEIGVDEVGRGCLLGPVLAAAVALPSPAVIQEHAATWERIKDSKKLSEKARATLSEFIKSQCSFGFGWIQAEEIDRINILRATLRAMRLSLDECMGKMRPSGALIRIDGDRFPTWDRDEAPGWDIQAECVVNGDNTYLAIAAASIIAKHERDTYMKQLVADHPSLNLYDIAKNKGYGTKRHLEGLTTHGATAFHRRSFRPVAASSCLGG